MLGWLGVCVSEYMGVWISWCLGDLVSVCRCVGIPVDLKVWVSACLGCR